MVVLPASAATRVDPDLDMILVRSRAASQIHGSKSCCHAIGVTRVVVAICESLAGGVTAAAAPPVENNAPPAKLRNH